MILDNVADYVTDLMSFDQTKVIIGRQNATQKTFSDNTIVVDTLSNSLQIGSNRDYDAATETEKLNTLSKARITLEFYGDDAYSNSYKFMNMQNTQLHRDLQATHNITVFRALSSNSIPQLKGKKYFDRYEIEMMVQYNEALEINTLRIDTIEPTYLVNQ